MRETNSVYDDAEVMFQMKKKMAQDHAVNIEKLDIVEVADQFMHLIYVR